MAVRRPPAAQVVYTRDHLLRCGVGPTHPMAHRLGSVVGKDRRWVLVLWSDAVTPVRVAREALCHPRAVAAHDASSRVVVQVSSSRKAG